MDKATVLKVAKLARLRIADDKVEAVSASLTNILKWIDQLNEVNIEGVEPMTSVVSQAAFRRVDVVTDGHKQGDIVANAPESAEGFFVVPKVVE
jgi:aspartyl-tRNA(Asn)/glutamyl-tRNA(Gln) amidotransferase subunit C